MRLPLCAALAALTLSGCAPERSVEAYCQTFADGMAQIQNDHPELGGTGQDPLVALANAVGAWGDFIALTDRLADVAPADVSSDVERVHDTLQGQVDAMKDVWKDPIGFLIGQVVSGLVNSPAFERMSAYTEANC
jgi:hypothetical protein